MDHAFQVNIAGIAGQVSVRLPTLGIGAAHVLLDGQPAPTGSEPRTFLLPRTDGTTIEARYEGGLSPKLRVDGIRYDLAPPVEPWLMVLVLAPFALMLVGGCIGGGIGGVAVGVNYLVSRQPWHVGVRAGGVLASGALASLVWLVTVVVIAVLSESG